MDFAEQALDLSEAFVPRDRSLGQQRLHGIAEALQCDTERMPRGGRVRAHGAPMQASEFVVTLEHQTLRGQAVRCYEAGARGRCTSETFPPPLIERSERTTHLMVPSDLAILQHREQLASQWIICGRQPLHPRLQYVEVAQTA